MNNNQINNAIGSGVLFPIILTPNTNGTSTWATVSGDNRLIENNIMAVLLFELGQRLRQENFGTRLMEALEEQNNQLLSFLVKRFLVEGINYWEPRIDLLQSDVTLTQNEDFLYINLTPRVILTQNVLDLNFNYNPKTGELYVNN